VVKGVKFVDIRDAGDPVEVARRYDVKCGRNHFLDITATHDNRDTIVHVVEQVASEVFIPLTVGAASELWTISSYAYAERIRSALTVRQCQIRNLSARPPAFWFTCIVVAWMLKSQPT